MLGLLMAASSSTGCSFGRRYAHSLVTSAPPGLCTSMVVDQGSAAPVWASPPPRACLKLSGLCCPQVPVDKHVIECHPSTSLQRQDWGSQSLHLPPSDGGDLVTGIRLNMSQPACICLRQQCLQGPAYRPARVAARQLTNMQLIDRSTAVLTEANRTSRVEPSLLHRSQHGPSAAAISCYTAANPTPCPQRRSLCGSMRCHECPHGIAHW